MTFSCPDKLIKMSLPCSRCDHVTTISCDSSKYMEVSCKFLGKIKGDYNQLAGIVNGCEHYSENLEKIKFCVDLN